MQRFPRQTSPVDVSTNISSSISSIISSVVSTPDGPSSSLPSSSPSSQPTSAPSSPPPTSIKTSQPPSSEPTSQPPSSEPSPSSRIANSTSSIDTHSSTSITPLITPFSFAASSSFGVQSSVTQNLTTITTMIDGQSTTITSVLPTNLATATPSASTSKRTAVIAGATSGLFALVLILLVAIFAYRKHQLRKSLAVSGKKKEGRGLLDGEEFDEDDAAPQTRSYQGSTTFLPQAMTSAPSLLKSRTTETGSIFREEVWPPASFVDPIAKQNSQVDLSKIVDDVMGPTGSGSAHGIDQSTSTAASQLGGSTLQSHERGLTDMSTTSTHSNFSSSSMNNNTPNPRAFNYTDPFASSSTQTSVYYPSTLPSGALAPTTPGTSTVLIATSTNSSSGPGISSQLPSSAAQPKKSSPLARKLTADGNALWVGRHVTRHGPDSHPPTSYGGPNMPH